ncbi:MAG TPA: hypothetical protein VFJ58_28785 [Armatimonadota bacterium]|nr:hypothetical protein [Armatimonadota bacterium]
MKISVKSFQDSFHPAVLLTALPVLSLFLSMVGCSGTPKAAGLSSGSPSPVLSGWVSFRAIHVGEENPGLRLVEVEGPDVCPCRLSPVYRVGLRATYQGRIWIVGDLNELRGLIRITDAVSAVKYVRLWAGLGDEAPLEDGNILEITDEGTYLHAKDWRGRRNSLPYDFHPGDDAILPKKAFRTEGFTLPQLKKTRDGFVIERWVLLMKKPTLNIERVREFVGRDGSYRRLVLKEIAPPEPPGTK